ncbi:MAG: exosortase/archaeosortase family protein [Candidatus Omnitrophota bacterium]
MLQVAGLRLQKNEKTITEKSEQRLAIRKIKKLKIMDKKLVDYLTVLLIVLFLAIMYYPAFIWMWERWHAPDTNYSHGILIPIVSLFLLYSRKERLKQIQIKPEGSGIIFVCLAILVHITGNMINFPFASAFSFIIMLIGIVLFLFGIKILKAVKFEILFLLFMIPAPLMLISNLTIRMKLFAAGIATNCLSVMGLKAVREGSMIRMGHSFLEIEAPCSGLRSLISLLAFGAAFAYLTKHKFWKKVVLFATALPIALIANAGRIVLLGWVSEVYGMQAAQGWVHDFSGFLLFFFAACAMIAVNSILITQKIDEQK